MTRKAASSRPEPDYSTRFRKGQSGNPHGRPRAKHKPTPSVFDVILDRQLQVERDGGCHQLSAEEALQHKLLQQAMAGSRNAQKKILRMIEQQELKRTRNASTSSEGWPRAECRDPDSVSEALLLLGICSQSDGFLVPWMGPFQHLLFEPWAVTLALKRKVPLHETTIRSIRIRTRDAGSITWPPGER